MPQCQGPVSSHREPRGLVYNVPTHANNYTSRQSKQPVLFGVPSFSQQSDPKSLLSQREGGLRVGGGRGRLHLLTGSVGSHPGACQHPGTLRCAQSQGAANTHSTLSSSWKIGLPAMQQMPGIVCHWAPRLLSVCPAVLPLPPLPWTCAGLSCTE